jgi:hypothetical protein
MSDQALIRLSGITKTYGSGQAAFQALKGIDLASMPVTSSPSWVPAVRASRPR